MCAYLQQWLKLLLSWCSHHQASCPLHQAACSHLLLAMHMEVAEGTCLLEHIWTDVLQQCSQLSCSIVGNVFRAVLNRATG